MSQTPFHTLRFRDPERNFAVFPVLGWIAEITTHIPNKGEQLVRYYGVYSNVSRGKRKKEEHKKDVIGKPEFVEVPRRERLLLTLPTAS